MQQLEKMREFEENGKIRLKGMSALIRDLITQRKATSAVKSSSQQLASEVWQ